MGRNHAWAQRSLHEELADNAEIVELVREDDAYAHKLYAALTNTEWQTTDVIDILKDCTWSASWRSVGGIIAELRGEGDYLDWYCSGNEGYVHEDIRKDLARLGWKCVEEDTPIGEEIKDHAWGKHLGIVGAFDSSDFIADCHDLKVHKHKDTNNE